VVGLEGLEPSIFGIPQSLQKFVIPRRVRLNFLFSGAQRHSH
jgi:hypothetical protein